MKWLQFSLIIFHKYNQASNKVKQVVQKIKCYTFILSAKVQIKQKIGYFGIRVETLIIIFNEKNEIQSETSCHRTVLAKLFLSHNQWSYDNV